MIAFWKMHGIGNDFVVVQAPFSPTPEEIVRLCDRSTGVGSDGLLVIKANPDQSLDLRMWNPDGSESGMCGNGLRCAALWADLNLGVQAAREIVLGGKGYTVNREQDNRYRVLMGRPSFDPLDIGLSAERPWIDEAIRVGESLEVATAVSMGNPHLVFFVDRNPGSFLPYGEGLEHHPSFSNRTNVHFAQVLDDTSIRMVTWERGAGPTLACGSGACAVAVAGWERGLCEGPQNVQLPGGPLHIAMTSEGVLMTGPAALTFTGRITPY